MKLPHLRNLLITTCLISIPLSAHENDDDFIDLLDRVVTSVAIDTFNEDRIHLIDYDPTSQNMLFRGDIPRNAKNQYDRGALLRGIKKAFNAYTASHSEYKKEKFPKKYQLIVISMLTLETQQEVDFLKIIYGYYSYKKASTLSPDEIPFETQYVNRNNDHWYWWWVRANVTHTPPFSEGVDWQTLSETLDLTSPMIEQKLIQQTWDGYSLNFVGLIELLRTYMETPGDKPFIIYLHSRNGINRSGSTQAAYNMRVHGMDIETAWNTSFISENGSPLDYYRQQEAKTFLMYYKAYLDSL